MSVEPKERLSEPLNIETLDRRKLRVFLERRRLGEASSRPGGMRLEEILEESLRRAQDLVPAGTGALLLDNPITKRRDKRENDLVVVTSFSMGKGNPYPPGRAVPVYGTNLADVYIEGKTFIGMDEGVSLVAVPVYIEGEVCGVLLMKNRVGRGQFNDRDEKLLAIFSDYMSSVIVNTLDAERAKEISVRDGLTGLYNDRYFHAQLSKEIVVAEDTGEDLSLAFMDLDNFKQVNDTHGHLAGSMVLNEVGGILKNTVNVQDATLTRYGGDEFVLVLPRVDAETGMDICERVRKTIQEYIFLRIEGPYGPPLRIGSLITCSVGLASYHQHVRKRFSIDQNKDAFLKLADRAMYASKDKGKNCVVLAAREADE